MLHLISGNGKTTERELNVFDRLGTGTTGLVGGGHVKKALLAGEGHDFLHLLEGFGKCGGGEAEDVGDFFGFTRGTCLFEAHVQTSGEEGIATETLTPADFLQGGIEIFGFFDDGLVDS